MEIQLNLEKFCIETETKRTYERLLRQYFRKSVSDQDKFATEKQIEGLKFFLEHADFGYLRRSCPELNGRRNISVTLKIPSNRYDLKIIYKGKNLVPRWKNEDKVSR